MAYLTSFFSCLKKNFRKFYSYPSIIGILSLVWFILRTGTRPSRAVYPCQKVAANQTMLFLGPTIFSSILVFKKRLLSILKSKFSQILKISLVIIVLITSYHLYLNYHQRQLKRDGNRTIPKTPVVVPPTSTPQPTEAPPTISPKDLPPISLKEISLEKATVSFGYDPQAVYGSKPPYDKEGSTAYNLVWKTIEDLRLGSSSNPLDELIEKGDTVLIKPNLVDDDPQVFTHPAVVRPLIDLAIAAGATTIYVGDGGPGYTFTWQVLKNTRYEEMVNILQNRHPEITIKAVNFNDRSNWHWVYLGEKSSFAGSGYGDYDLVDVLYKTMYQSKYYKTADPQGVNPNGQCLGWYAIPNVILESDVFINVPKMKTHRQMIATLTLKNHVGSTVDNTFSDSWGNGARIAHYKTGSSAGENYFGNDIFWRAILDVNKIILYADKEGKLQTTPQRKYFNVLDGIEASEKSSHYPESKLYEAKAILASVDPVALAAVATRLMGYDFHLISHLEKAVSEKNFPIGIYDSSKVMVVGEEINSRFNHLFEYNPNWAEQAKARNFALTDFTPPSINSVEATRGFTGITITADISEGMTAYVLYEIGNFWRVEKMVKDSSQYSGEIPKNATAYQILAQDESFNTVCSSGPAL